MPQFSPCPISNAPSKIPYVGFSPIRLQTERRLYWSAMSFPCFTILKCDSHVHILKTWFDKAFVLNHANSNHVAQGLLASLIFRTVQSRGPLLGVVIVSLTIIATMPSSEDLKPTEQLPVVRLYALPCHAESYWLVMRSSPLYLPIFS